MVLHSLWELIEKELISNESRPDLFNQYRSLDENLDLADAPSVRRKNLRNYFDSFSEKPSILLVGEAAGPWGCRFSGVPFTGEKQLFEKSVPFPGEQSSRNDPKYPIRKSPPYISTSAKIFWDVLRPYHDKFLVWDCVPFHPHVEGTSLSIRTPRKEEIKEFSKLLYKIIEVIEPVEILAIGRKAEEALSLLSKRSIYGRHPANGGAKKFREEMENYFRSFSVKVTNKPSLPFARSYWVQSGKLLAGFYPGSPDCEEAAKKLSGLLDCGIRHVINLMEEGETDQSDRLFTPYAENLIILGKQRGIEVTVTRYPIRDVSVPSAEEMKAILDEIDRTISANRPVYVHCWGGRGRTGTVAGCHLVRHGLPGEGALKRIKELRRNEPTGHFPSPETKAQEEMVLSWEKSNKKI